MDWKINNRHFGFVVDNVKSVHQNIVKIKINKLCSCYTCYEDCGKETET